MARELFHAAHYNIIAAQIRKQLEPTYPCEVGPVKRNTLIDLAISLAERFQEDNPRFDPVKFLDACSPDSERWPISELWVQEENVTES